MCKHLMVACLMALAATSSSAAGQPVRQLVVEGKRVVDRQTQREVRYSDLDLANSVDRGRLLRRISRAVDDLCGNDANSVEVLEHTNWPCRDGAWQSARPQIDAAFARGAYGQAAVTATIEISAVPQQ